MFAFIISTELFSSTNFTSLSYQPSSSVFDQSRHLLSQKFASYSPSFRMSTLVNCTVTDGHICMGFAKEDCMFFH
ncbi:hypothetical protein PVAG01_10823 [Phlyctema vagabunda]|uniref:Uncharacterized protein n=1 Tax=Phlyctema vagabunda TaxID=108571 RepID=A0ABR4P3C6_9HELO